jgi:hypothetical protein
MTPFELFERTEPYCYGRSKIGKIIRKYQFLQKNYTTFFSLNRFLHPITGKVFPEFQNQTSKKIALQLKEIRYGK